MSLKKRDKFHHGDLREALLSAAEGLLDEGGTDKVTIRAVARATGVSHAAPGNHFADRKALLTALCTRFFTDLRNTIAHAMSLADGSAEERLFTFMDALVEYGLAHKERYRLLWQPNMINSEDTALQQMMDGLYDDFTDIIKERYTDGTYDMDTIAVALWSMCHGYVAMRADNMFVPMDDSKTKLPRHRAMISSYLKGLQ